MANKGQFTKVNTLEFPFSVYSKAFQHNTTVNHGQLLPIDCFRVSPNEKINYNDINMRIILSTPIKPIADSLEWHLRAYFVPDRLVWEHTKEFYGENKSSKGYDLTDRVIPYITNASVNPLNVDEDTFYNNGDVSLSIAKYLGQPINVIHGNDFVINSDGIHLDGTIDADTALKVSVLKERGYYLIYNHYFRHPFLQDPYVINTGDTGAIGLHGLSTLYVDDPLLYVSKTFDYFTTALLDPTPFKVVLPLGTSAPVIGASTMHDLGTNGLKLGDGTANTGSYSTFNLQLTKDANTTGKAGAVYNGASAQTTNTNSTKKIVQTNMVADLTNATSATVDSLKLALGMDTFFLRSNYSGGRFDLEMKLHYGAEVDELEIQEPLPLGSAKGYIQISEILQTTGAADSSSTSLGEQGAYSTTIVRGKSLFTRRFKEPGHVFVMFYTRQANQTYSQGFLREDLKSTRFEFFTSELAGIASQEIKLAEIYAADSDAGTAIFGTQEAWSEERMRHDRNSGLMDPVVSSLGQIWTLGNYFTQKPTLSEDFILENRNNISRVLKTTTDGPDYKVFYFARYRDENEVPVNPESLLKAPFSF